MSDSRFERSIYFTVVFIILLLFISSKVISLPFDEVRNLLKKSSIKVIGEERIYEKEQLFEYINGGADIYLEYGFMKVLTQKISSNKQIFDLSIYEMQSDSASYGILTFSQYEGMDEVKVIPDGRISPGRMIFSKGRFFCMVQQESIDSVSKTQIIAIGREIAEFLPAGTARVNMDRYLPTQNRVRFSEKFITGPLGLRSCFYLVDDDIFELSKSRSGYFAKYDFSGKTLSMLVVPMNEDSVKDICKKADAIFKDKFKEAEARGSISFYKDKKGRFYSLTHRKDKIIFFYRVQEIENINKILSHM